MKKLKEWARRMMRRGTHRDGIRPAVVLWMVRAREIRAARTYPAAAIVRYSRAAQQRIIATQRVPARSRFATAARPAQQRAAAAVSTAVAVGSSIARRVGAHRHDGQTTAEHHDLVTKIMKRQARDERRLAKQRARGEQSLFARRPRGEFAWQ